MLMYMRMCTCVRSEYATKATAASGKTAPPLYAMGAAPEPAAVSHGSHTPPTPPPSMVAAIASAAMSMPAVTMAGDRAPRARSSQRGCDAADPAQLLGAHVCKLRIGGGQMCYVAMFRNVGL